MDRSGRFCSCQNPTACPNSCVIMPKRKHPEPRDKACCPLRRPTKLQQLMKDEKGFYYCIRTHWFGKTY